MLLLSTFTWIIIGVAVVVLAVVIGTKIKDRYYQKQQGQVKAGKGSKIPCWPAKYYRLIQPVRSKLPKSNLPAP